MLKYTQKENVLLVLCLAPHQMLHGNTVYKYVCLHLITDIIYVRIYIYIYKVSFQNFRHSHLGVRNTTALNLPLLQGKQMVAKKTQRTKRQKSK